MKIFYSSYNGKISYQNSLSFSFEGVDVEFRDDLNALADLTKRVKRLNFSKKYYFLSISKRKKVLDSRIVTIEIVLSEAILECSTKKRLFSIAL